MLRCVPQVSGGFPKRRGSPSVGVMRKIELSTSEWCASGYLARTFVDRLFGNLRTPAGAVLVMRTRSVHTFGQTAPIEVVGLDSDGWVVATRTLPPNRLAVLPAARMIVELPYGSPVPGPGDRIELSHG
jgi:uncharacterized membrane protein (UPF0127 family)